MADLGTLTPAPAPLLAAQLPGFARLPYPRRHAGAIISGQGAPFRTPSSINQGYRSSLPSEAAPPAGSVQYTDAHEIALLLWAVAGSNTVSVPVTLSEPSDQPPALSVAADATLGIAAASAAVDETLTTLQTLELTFTAAASGRAKVILSWRSLAYTGAVTYGPVSVS